MKKIILLCIGLLIIALTSVNLFAPGALYNATQDATRAAAGLEVKQITAGEYEYTYADNGKTDKPVLLMVHGFTADKDNWARMALFLKNDYHLIALDLLGHGQSPRDINADYKISSQVQRVKDFADALGLEKFHMAGNSMGGYITAMYAAKHPEQILSAILFDNAGVAQPTPSDMLVALENKQAHPLIIRSSEDVDKFFNFVFADVPFMTGSIKQYYAEQSIPLAPLYEKIFADFHEIPEEQLEPLLPTIKAPVQIIWGREDRVLDVSSIETMRPLLKNLQIIIMDDVGHLPMLESPSQSAQLVHQFIQSL